MSAYARERLGLQVETGTLESWPHSDERFDLINMVQIVGHFVELNHAFEKAARATLPNGYWLIESWNRASWTARITGKWWHEYSPPSVLHWFTPYTLKRLAAQFGFHEVARGRPLKRLNGAHAASLLSYKLTAGNLKIGRLAAKATELIPPNASLPYPAEDLFWMLLRRSGDFH
jgi:SAM-dependent methyltransferase